MNYKRNDMHEHVYYRMYSNSHNHTNPSIIYVYTYYNSNPGFRIIQTTIEMFVYSFAKHVEA